MPRHFFIVTKLRRLILCSSSTVVFLPIYRTSPGLAAEDGSKASVQKCLNIYVTTQKIVLLLVGNSELRKLRRTNSKLRTSI